MFKKALIKLTLTYSVLFLALFWIFSFGLYFWMNNSFGTGYINQVQQIQKEQTGQNEGEFDSQTTTLVAIAGSVAFDQLKMILLVLNGVFVLIIPALSWFLAQRSLKPIRLAHEQQKQFVSDVSHELKTPLSIISGEMEVTLKKDRNIKDYKKTIISTKEEINRLSKLVENLLFLVRDDQNSQALQKSMVDLTDIVNSIVVQLKGYLTEKNLILHFKPAKETTTVFGQEDLLRQLFFNLIDNAIKYTPTGGSIRITLQKGPMGAVVVIQDNGIGISANNLNKIFDRFYRADSSRSEIKGYGLGLPIVRTIVEKHRGKIDITSKKGKGTKVKITLPYV